MRLSPRPSSFLFHPLESDIQVCYKSTSNQGQAITTRSVLLYQTGSVTDIVAVLRFARTCLRTPNHFIHRYFVKQDLIPPLLDLLEEESSRDNMLSSSCMDVLDLIRKVSLSVGHGRSRADPIKGKHQADHQPYFRQLPQPPRGPWSAPISTCIHSRSHDTLGTEQRATTRPSSTRCRSHCVRIWMEDPSPRGRLL